MANFTVRVLGISMVALSCWVSVWPGEMSGDPQSTELAGPFLGQPLPGNDAEIFAPGLVSVDGRYEYALSIHPDGDRILFTVEVPDKGATVHYSQVKGGRWTSPRPVSLTGGAKKNEMEAFFSPDGQALFFAPFNEGMDVRIWMADLTPKGWQNSRALVGPISQDPAFYPVMSRDGFLYYTNLAKRAVYRAGLANGEAESPSAAGLDVGGHAFPDPDGKFMLVDSASLNSEGTRDIFVVFREADGGWGAPIPLGPGVNTDHSETCPSLSPDGEVLFFSRYNEPGKLSNIYWVSSDVIARQEE